MKIQKRYIRTYNGKKYYRFLVGIPSGKLKKAGLKPDDEVDLIVDSGKIVIRKNQD